MSHPPSPDHLQRQHLGRISEADLERALRHHQRAITALASPAPTGLGRTTLESLIHRLKADLSALATELPPNLHTVNSIAAKEERPETEVARG